MITTVQTPVHGKVLVNEQGSVAYDLLVLGLHGYGETCEKQMERLVDVDWPASALMCSVEALFPMYNTNGTVGGSWMTSMNRQQNVVDNAAYLNNVIASLSEKYTWRKCVLCGFSQGGMLLYWLCAADLIKADFLATVGAELPFDIPLDALSNLPPLLMGRGKADSFYEHDKFVDDYQRILDGGSIVDCVEWRGGHRWRKPFSDALAASLESLLK